MSEPLPIEWLQKYAHSISRRWVWRVQSDDLFQEGVCAWLAQSADTPPKLRYSRVYWRMFRFAAAEVYGSLQAYRQAYRRRELQRRPPKRVKKPQTEAERLAKKRKATATQRANPVNREAERERKKAAYWRDKQLRVKYPERKAVSHDSDRGTESSNSSQASTSQGPKQILYRDQESAESGPITRPVEQ